MPERTIALALGSNIGNRLAMLSQAINLLCRSGFHVTAMSRVWETLPWGVTEQPRFLNMCLTAITTLEPVEILCTIKDIEKRLGRKPSKRWGPREIDIDILLIGDEIIKMPDLTVPHPFMHDRAFVLAPLVEIAPTIVHPVLKKSLQALFDELPQVEMEWVIKL